MRPLTRGELQLIRGFLKAHNRTRDLALFNVAIDTMLRSADVLELRVQDVTDHRGEVVERFSVMQGKTDNPVTCSLFPETRACLAEIIAEKGGAKGAYLFTAMGSSQNRPLTTRHFRGLIKEWIEPLNLDPKYYSCHSLRRTRASIVYKETSNLRVVQQLLGHASMTHTVRYLGVSIDDALNMSEKYDV